MTRHPWESEKAHWLPCSTIAWGCSRYREEMRTKLYCQEAWRLTQTQQGSRNYCGKCFLHSCLWLFNPVLGQTGLGEENYLSLGREAWVLLFNEGEEHTEKNKDSGVSHSSRETHCLPSLSVSSSTSLSRAPTFFELYRPLSAGEDIDLTKHIRF